MCAGSYTQTFARKHLLKDVHACMNVHTDACTHSQEWHRLHLCRVPRACLQLDRGRAFLCPVLPASKKYRLGPALWCGRFSLRLFK